MKLKRWAISWILLTCIMICPVHSVYAVQIGDLSRYCSIDDTKMRDFEKKNADEGEYVVQPIQVYSDVATKYVVCVQKATIRSGAGIRCRETGTLWRGDEIIVSRIINGWARFEVDSGWNYIRVREIKKIKKCKPSSVSQKYTVIEKTVYRRSGPGYNYYITGTLKKGNYIYVKSVKNGWAKFKVKSKWNYVRSSSLKKSPKKR